MKLVNKIHELVDSDWAVEQIQWAVDSTIRKIISSSVKSIKQALNESHDNPGSGASDPMAITDQFHIAVIKDFMDAVLYQKPPKVNIDEAKKSVALINAIYQSMGNKIN